MEGKSYSLSRDVVDYIEDFRKLSKLKTSSASLEVIVQQHRLLSPRIQQQEAKQKLEEALAVLRGLGIDEEPLKVWAGFPLSPEPHTPNTSDNKGDDKTCKE